MDSETTSQKRPINNIRVECLEGHRGEEAPQRFYLGTHPIHIVEIMDRWVGREDRYFKVRAEDSDVYILRHDHQTRQWELTLFSREAYLIGNENGVHYPGTPSEPKAGMRGH